MRNPWAYIAAPFVAIAWLWLVCVWGIALEKYADRRDFVYIFSAIIITVFVASISYGIYLLIS